MSETKVHEWDRVPYVISFPESPKFLEVYGFAGSRGLTWLEGHRFVPRNRPSKTVYLFMHPSSTLQLLPMPSALADAGLHVICAQSRYPKNDSALIMEKVCYDMGQHIKWAREVGGYEKVILVGWSGGGFLSLFYQSQAQNPTITHTPAGDEYDLTVAKMVPADGIIFISAHLSRAETLTEMLDPSVKDELNPFDRDVKLDIYSEDCPYQPPYSQDFIAHFRAAQLARSRRITAWVDDMLARLKSMKGPESEYAFVVHRTWCDVRWLDPTIDPNGRPPGMTVLGPPAITNSAPAGLARYTSLRSWLSQWSIERSQSNGPPSAARITGTPVLQVVNEADDGVPATHNPTIYNALGTHDKEMFSIAGANHYYDGQPEALRKCIEKVIDWSRQRSLLD